MIDLLLDGSTHAMLLTWTPFIVGGLTLNAAITVAAMALGTVVGISLAFLRSGNPARSVPNTAGATVGLGATALCRNVPSFVLMFYLAAMLPTDDVIPPWWKASLALAFPVAGFVSDQLVGARRAERSIVGPAVRAAWGSYALIVFMASATASAIGADEAVSRAARIAALHDEPNFLIVAYIWVAALFVGATVTARFIAGSGRYLTSTILRRAGQKLKFTQQAFAAD